MPELCFFSACAPASAPTKTEENATEPQETGTLPVTEPAQVPLPYTLEAQPGITADNIDYWQSVDVGYNCFIVERDGKFGSMDRDGNIITEPFCENIELILYCLASRQNYGKWGLFATKGDISCWAGQGYTVASDGSFVSDEQYPMDGGSLATIYWTDEGAKMIVMEGLGEPILLHDFSYTKFQQNSYCLKTAYHNVAGIEKHPTVIPVQKAKGFVSADRYGYGYGYNLDYEAVLESEKYGLFDLQGGYMLTDFIYDECSSFLIDGVFAVRIGNRCGYVSEEGDEITPVDLDPAVQKTSYEFYQPVNGYIVTMKDGKYGLMRTNGEVVLENEYSAVSQVGPEGVFWAKKTGVWYRGQMLA